ncbi:MAG: hypothetical protein ACHP65_06105 [Legionellales bacterium]
MKKALLTLISFWAFFIPHLASAGTGLLFNVSASGQSTELNITLCLNGKGPLSCQNYNVSSLDLTVLTTVPNHSYASAAIKINTPGYVPTGCTPLSNGYCSFSVSNTKNASIYCRPSSLSKWAYVSDLSSNLWQCPINSTSGEFTTACTALTNSPAFVSTVGTVLNTFAGTTYAYIGDNSPILWQCPINTTTGTFSAPCVALTNTTSFAVTFGATFNTFAGTTYAYVSDFSSTLWQCPINATTGEFSGSCAALTNTSAFTRILGVTFNTFAGTTYAYVSDSSDTLWQCPINTATGGFSAACTALTNTTSFAYSTNVTFNTFAGTTYAYVSDDSDTLWQCPINTATGGFSAACTALTNVISFFETTDMTFDSFAGTTYAYVSDFSSNLWQCPINTATGAFSAACTALTNAMPFVNTTSVTGRL